MRARVRKRASFLLGLAFRSVIGSPFWPVVMILGLGHELCVVCLGRAFVGKPVHEGPRVYEPDTYIYQTIAKSNSTLVYFGTPLRQ